MRLSTRAVHATPATPFNKAALPSFPTPGPRPSFPLCVGSGGSSSALFRPTRVARIPPQLMRLLVAGGAALLQVFVVAFQRESQRLRYESEATGTAEGMGNKRHMSGVEAVQVLGLDRNYPTLFSEIQKAESNASASPTATSTPLPLKEGKAKEEAKRNFDRMLALAVAEDNMFLAGKLSAAYRLCVDPNWDQVEAVEENHSSAPSDDPGDGKQQ